MHSPQGILVLPSPTDRKITGVTKNLRELFDLDPLISTDLVIKKFKTSTKLAKGIKDGKILIGNIEYKFERK